MAINELDPSTRGEFRRLNFIPLEKVDPEDLITYRRPEGWNTVHTTLDGMTQSLWEGNSSPEVRIQVIKTLGGPEREYLTDHIERQFEEQGISLVRARFKPEVNRNKERLIKRNWDKKVVNIHDSETGWSKVMEYMFKGSGYQGMHPIFASQVFNPDIWQTGGKPVVLCLEGPPRFVSNPMIPEDKLHFGKWARLNRRQGDDDIVDPDFIYNGLNWMLEAPNVGLLIVQDADYPCVDVNSSNIKQAYERVLEPGPWTEGEAAAWYKKYGGNNWQYWMMEFSGGSPEIARALALSERLRPDSKKTHKMKAVGMLAQNAKPFTDTQLKRVLGTWSVKEQLGLKYHPEQWQLEAGVQGKVNKTKEDANRVSFYRELESRLFHSGFSAYGTTYNNEEVQIIRRSLQPAIYSLLAENKPLTREILLSIKKSYKDSEIKQDWSNYPGVLEFYRSLNSKIEDMLKKL